MKELVINIYELARELILNPRDFWKLHANSGESQEDLFKNILLPVIGAVACAIFFGEFFRSDYFRIWVAVLWIIREILLFSAIYFVGVYGSSKLINYFGYEAKTEVLQKLVGYSMVPFLLISIVTGLFPFFYFLDILGVYGFYIFFVGGRELLLFPREKQDSIIFKIVTANYVVFGLLSFTTAKLLMLLD